METDMAQTAIPREKLQLLLEVGAKQQLQRYAKFLDVSMTRYLERLAGNIEKHTLAALTESQRERYLAGDLRRLEMTPDELSADMAHGASARTSKQSDLAS
jgi:hypothetical protein